MWRLYAGLALADSEPPRYLPATRRLCVLCRNACQHDTLPKHSRLSSIFLAYTVALTVRHSLSPPALLPSPSLRPESRRPLAYCADISHSQHRHSQADTHTLYGAELPSTAPQGRVFALRQAGSERAERRYSRSPAVQLDRGQLELCRDLLVSDLLCLADRLALEPLCGQGRRSDRGSASEGLEL